jgi:hypothetical protein
MPESNRINRTESSTGKSGHGFFIVKKNFTKLPKLRNPILVEGLPGIGSVGKIAIDYLVDNLKSELLYKIHSYNFHPSVLLNSESFVELPAVNMHVSKGKNRDIVFLSGDVQPLDERASYEFCEKILDLAQELGCSEVITLGGIGLPTEIKNPAVFGAVTDKETLLRYGKFKSINFKANERVEAIFGASGLLLGLARLRGMTGISLLAETYAHQLHLGFSEAKVLLRELTNILDIKVSFAGLENQIKEKEQEKSRIRDLQKPIKALKPPVYDKTETPYIG